MRILAIALAFLIGAGSAFAAGPGPTGSNGCPITGCVYIGPITGQDGGVWNASGLSGSKINGLTILPSTGSLIIGNGKNFTLNNSLTFTGSDNTSFLFPSTSDTIPGLGQAQAFSRPQTFSVGQIVPSQHYDATAFGSCIWDGAHDVAPCIQSAINVAVAAGNAEVDLPAEVMWLGSTLAPSGSLMLRGRGPGSILRVAPTNSASVSALSLSGIANVTISDVTFDGGAVGGATTAPTVFTGSSSGSTLTVSILPTNGIPIVSGDFLYCTGCAANVRITGGSGTTWTTSAALNAAASSVITGIPAGMSGSVDTNSIFNPSGTPSGAPLAVGDVLYWSTGSAPITSQVDATHWQLGGSPGAVSFRQFYAAPTGPAGGLSTMVQLFATTNVKFDRVIFQRSTGIAMLGSEVNRTTVTNSAFLDDGNRWKATFALNDRQSALNLCCGDGISLGYNNSITGNYFQDIGLDATSVAGQTRLIVSDNRYDLTNGQVAIVGSPNYPGAIFPLVSRDVSITGNVIRGAAGNCIDAPGLQNASIVGNVIAKCGNAGIGLFQGGTLVSGQGLIFTSFTGAFGATATGTGSGTSLSLTGIVGNIYPGSAASASISGTGVPANTYIVSGSAGSYVTNNATTASGASISVSSNVMDASSVTAGTLVVGAVVGGTTAPLPTLPTYITALGTGAGGAGTYVTSQTQYLAGKALFSGLNAKAVTISGNTIIDIDQGLIASDWSGAITLGSGIPDRITINDNTIVDNQATPTMLYGIALQNGFSAPPLWNAQPSSLNIGATNTIVGAVTAQTVGVPTFTVSGSSAGTPSGTDRVGTFVAGTASPSTVIITPGGGATPAAAHGWNCTALDRNSGVSLLQTTSTTTTATIAGNTTSGDVVSVSCAPY